MYHFVKIHSFSSLLVIFCVCLFSFAIQLNKEQSASEKNLAIFVEINFTTEHKSFFTASRWMARIFFQWMNELYQMHNAFIPASVDWDFSFFSISVYET